MDEPTTPPGLRAFYDLLRSDPSKALRVASAWIERNPQSSSAYFTRHHVWMDLGETGHALDDINRAIMIEPKQSNIGARGDVFHDIGDYQRAVADYAQAEAIDPTRWAENAFPLLFHADAHARLGDERAALGCCARLPEHFWSPGIHGTPRGYKTQIAEELKRRAAAARPEGGRP
jgi:tetratricopeptide (TPR) repeat protein